MKVKLTNSELVMAALIGCRRHIASLKLKQAHGATDTWTINIEGACGELAAAKALNLFWDGGVNTFSAPDLQPNIQVRTSSNHDWGLIVRRNDKDDEIFVLVTGVSPEFVVRGWIVGKSAKNNKWFRTYNNRPEAYFVPQSALNPVGTLKAHLDSIPPF